MNRILLLALLLLSDICFGQLKNSWPTKGYMDSTKAIIPIAWKKFIKEYRIEEMHIKFFQLPIRKMKIKILPQYNFKTNVEYNERDIDSKLELDSITRNFIITHKSISLYSYMSYNKKTQNLHLYLPWPYDSLNVISKQILKKKKVFEINPFSETYFFFEKDVLMVYYRGTNSFMKASEFFSNECYQKRLKYWRKFLEKRKINPNAEWDPEE